MNEKDLLNRLQQECSEVQIPDSLTPEAIEKKLKLVEDQKKQKSVKRNRLYRNCGLIAASLAIVILGINSLSVLNRGSVNEEAETNGKIETAESYDQLYDCIKDAQEEYGGGEMPALFNFFGAGSVEEAAVEESMDMAAAPMDRGMATGAGGDYSTTNVRQQGVDEADIAKTDGASRSSEHKANRATKAATLLLLFHNEIPPHFSLSYKGAGESYKSGESKCRGPGGREKT